MASAFLDGADRDAGDAGDLAVDESLPGQATCSVYCRLWVHYSMVSPTADIFGEANMTCDNQCRERDSNPHALSGRRF